MKTNVTPSSLASYDHLKAHIMGECQRKILSVMEAGKVYTRKQIARMTDMETSSVSGRMNELITMEVVQVIGSIRCPISGKLVEAVQLVPDQKDLFA